MKHHRADKSDYLLIDDFISKLSCWRSVTIPEQQMDKQLDLDIDKLRDKSSNNNPAKQAEQKKPKLKLKTGGKKTKTKTEPNVPLDEKPKRALPNKSNHYLKLAKQK